MVFVRRFWISRTPSYPLPIMPSYHLGLSSLVRASNRTVSLRLRTCECPGPQLPLLGMCVQPEEGFVVACSTLERQPYPVNKEVEMEKRAKGVMKGHDSSRKPVSICCQQGSLSSPQALPYLGSIGPCLMTVPHEASGKPVSAFEVKTYGIRQV